MGERASERTPEDVQAAITRKGFTWTAARTAFAQLPPEQKRARLGLQVNDAELKAHAKAIQASALLARSAAAAPPAVDWRNNNGSWVTSVKDQQNCGSCVSFATAGTIEARLRIACRDAGMAVDLSEAHLFYCGCGNCCATGWNFALALDFAKTTGVVRDEDFPYTPNDQPCRAGLTPFLKIKAWTSVLSVADRKSVLAAKGPMVAGLAIFDDFYSYTGGVYRVTSQTLVGYHAVCVVGYDDAQQCWICKNSWGPGFGESGYFRIGYGESGIDTEFAFYDVDVDCTGPTPTPTDTCQTYLPYLRQVISASRSHSTLRAYLRYYVCRRGRRPVAYNAAVIRVVRAVALILQNCPQYRQPFCQAVG